MYDTRFALQVLRPLAAPPLYFVWSWYFPSEHIRKPVTAHQQRIASSCTVLYNLLVCHRATKVFEESVDITRYQQFFLHINQYYPSSFICGQQNLQTIFSCRVCLICLVKLFYIEVIMLG